MNAKIMVVVGARPNFMKAAPIIAALRRYNEFSARRPTGERSEEDNITLAPLLVHTGQHYDEVMSDRFFADLNIPKPDVHLGVGAGSHATQTAKILSCFEEVLLRERPDVLVVVGDVNSTLACALVASKISFDQKGTRPLIAHVEAGLRSFDRSMPEEINRIVTDHVSDLLFVTEASGRRNLREEGVAAERIHMVGNTMIDSLLAFKDKSDRSNILSKLALRAGPGDPVSPYALLTLHRPSNVDDRDAFQNILAGIEELSNTCRIIFPVHPRTRARIGEFGLEHRFTFIDPASTESNAVGSKGVHLVDPLGYLDFLCLMQHAMVVVTDSGGIQEETTCLGIPCVTVRENTERPVTIEMGTNILAGVSQDGIRGAIRQQRAKRKSSGTVPEGWDGKAAERIVGVVSQELAKRRSAFSLA